MMVICCRCGRWWYGIGSCPGHPDRKCGHEKCKGCGAGKLEPGIEQIIINPKVTNGVS